MPALVGRSRALIGGLPSQARGTLAYLDFTKGLYAARGRRTSLNGIIGNTRATLAQGFDTSLNLFAAAPGQSLVIPGRGLLSSSQRTNGIRNNTMAGGTSPSTLPTNWQSLNGNGITRTYTFGITAGGVSYMDARFAGTVTDGNGVDLRLDQSNGIAAANGQTWSTSAYVAMVGGSISGINNIVINNYIRNSGFTSVQQIPSTDIKGLLTATPQRFWVTGTITDATAAYIQPLLIISVPNGSTIDITLRIFRPQCEQGAYPSAAIPTSSGAAQRNGDAVNLLDMSLLPSTDVSIFVEYESMVGAVTRSTAAPLLRKRLASGTEDYWLTETATSAKLQLWVRNSVDIAAMTAANAPVAGTVYRMAARIRQDDFAAAFSAALQPTILTDTAGTPATSAASVAAIGHDGFGSSQPDDFIRLVAVMPYRSNAELLAWAQAA